MQIPRNGTPSPHAGGERADEALVAQRREGGRAAPTPGSTIRSASATWSGRRSGGSGAEVVQGVAGHSGRSRPVVDHIDHPRPRVANPVP